MGKTARAKGRSSVVVWKRRTVGWPVASYPDRGVDGGHKQGESPCAVRERLNVKAGWRHRAHARRKRLNGTAAEPTPSLVHLSRPQQGASGRIATRHRRGRRNRSRFPLPFGGGDRSGCRLVSALTVPLREHRLLSHHPQRWSRAPPRFPGYGDHGACNRPEGQRVPFTRARTRLGDGAVTGRGGGAARDGLAHPCQCTCHTGQRGVAGAAARRWGSPITASPNGERSRLGGGANATVIPVTGA